MALMSTTKFFCRNNVTRKRWHCLCFPPFPYFFYHTVRQTNPKTFKKYRWRKTKLMHFARENFIIHARPDDYKIL